MEPLSTAAIAIVGKLVMTEVTKAVLTGAKNQLQPDKMEQLLKQSIESAQAAQPETGGIFFRCQFKVAKEFLEQFFKSSSVVKELRKPLQDNGKPNVDILVEAFDRSAKQHSDMQNYIPDTLRPWMETFVDSYFEQTIQGICFQVAKEQYLKQLARRVDDVKFVGIAVPGEEVEKQEVLAQIFVMPDVRGTSNRNSADEIDYGCIIDSAPANLPEQEYQELVNSVRRKNLLQEQKKWATRDRTAPRILAQKVINLPKKKAVVLGAPGSGKTMLASYFALMLCKTTQSDPTQIGLKAEDDYLPVVVRIRDWILQPNMGLLEYLRSNAEANLSCKELPTGFFEHWLERGRALILLDGLDEVVDEAQRRKIAEQIETFLHQYQDNPAVITSRPAGYRWDFFNLDEFPHYTLESFDDKQVATFIDHWYDSRLKDDPAQAERRKTDLQKAFARNERIRLLAKNPLLLTIITLIHRYQAELPRQRCKLYEKAVETLLTSWDSGKEIKLYSQVLLFLKSDDLLYILKKLAYWIHTQGSTGETEGGTLIDKEELIRWLRKEIQTLKKCEAHEAKGEAERFIDFIQRRTGLLNGQGRDRYAFVHKTFQEYLTAEEIFDRADVEDDTEIILAHFRQHLHDQHWREVLLLLVSKLKGKKAQKAIQAVLDAGSEYEQWLHRDLLFAGWCLTEDPPELTVVAQDWVGEILDRLVSLEVAKSKRIGSKIRGEVEKILHCFGETTLERVSLEKLQAQGDRIDRFRLLKFQAELGQKKEAIDKLLSLLQDKDSDVRSSAIQLSYSLNNLSVVNRVFSLLGDRNGLVGLRASSFLRYCGNTSKNVVDDLLSSLGNKNPNVRLRAVEALRQLEYKSEEILYALLPLLRDENSSVRAGVAEALGWLANTSEAVLNGLRSLLGDEDLGVLARVVEALGRLGNPSEEVVNLSLSLLSHGDMNIYWRVGAVLCRENANQKVINSLISLLKDENWNIRYNAVQVLERFEYLHENIIIELLHLLKDERSNIRYHVAAILINSGNNNSEVVNTLTSLLEDENSNTRCNVARLLIDKLGNRNLKVVGVLLSLVKSEISQGDRFYAARILNEFKISSPEVINLWWSLLRDRELSMRSIASQALSQLSKTSDIIRPKVVQWLEQNLDDDGIGDAIDCLWSIVVE
jgi:HEAT repeat protein